MTTPVMTSGNMVQCSHGSGTVSPKGAQSRVKVDGKPVLVDGDFDNASVANCQASGPNITPCKNASEQTTGAATKLKIQGKAVLLTNVVGPTDAKPPATYAALPVGGQTRLKVV